MKTKNIYYIMPILLIFLLDFFMRNILIGLKGISINILISGTVIVEFLLLGILVFIWMPKIEGKSIKSIGYNQLKFRHVGIGIIGFVIATLLSIISGMIVESFGLKSLRMLQENIRNLSVVTLIALFLVGPIFEEFFYRGYIIERILETSKSKFLAFAVSTFCFSIVHVYFFGLGPSIQNIIFSMILVYMYLKYRSIWPCVVTHGINSVFVYIIFPLVGS